MCIKTGLNHFGYLSYLLLLNIDNLITFWIFDLKKSDLITNF